MEELLDRDDFDALDELELDGAEFKREALLDDDLDCRVDEDLVVCTEAVLDVTDVAFAEPVEDYFPVRDDDLIPRVDDGFDKHSPNPS